MSFQSLEIVLCCFAGSTFLSSAFLKRGLPIGRDKNEGLRREGATHAVYLPTLNLSILKKMKIMQGCFFKHISVLWQTMNINE